jgi:hypothetical protein
MRRPGRCPAFFVAQIFNNHLQCPLGATKGISGAKKRFHPEPEKEGRGYGR